SRLDGVPRRGDPPGAESGPGGPLCPGDPAAQARAEPRLRAPAELRLGPSSDRSHVGDDPWLAQDGRGDDMNPPGPALRVLPVLLRYRALLIVLGNMAIATTAYVAAFALRFDLSIPPRYAAILLATLPLLLVCKLIGFWTLGLFSGWWSHVSVRDAEDVVRGSLLASVLFLAAMVFLHPDGLHGFPRAVFVLDLVLCTALMGGARLAIRLARDQRGRPAVRRVARPPPRAPDPRGAGRGAGHVHADAGGADGRPPAAQAGPPGSGPAAVPGGGQDGAGHRGGRVHRLRALPPPQCIRAGAPR